MRFDTSQFMKLGQQMKLGPHMIQSMEILQMSLTELQERIDQELESNATLEIAEGSADQLDNDALRQAEGDEAIGSREDRPLSMGDASGQDDFERLESFEREHPDAADNDHQSESFTRDAEAERDYDPRSTGGDEDAKSGALANHASHADHFTDQLLDQWRYADIKPDLRPLGKILIPYIEEDGYLRTPLPTIAEKTTPAVSVADLERGLQAIQLLLEPAGLAARDMRECLLLQIDAAEDKADSDTLPLWELTRAVVDQHLEDLKTNRLPKIAQKLSVDIDRLKSAIALLRKLKLAPGRELSSVPVTGIVPDGIVEYDADSDRYYAYLNDRRLPNLRVNQEYAKLAKDKAAPKPTREFLKTSIGNAAFLIDAIAQRKRTLLRVLEAVVEAQREFFDYGPQSIKPLPMTKVAEQLGIHVATVSRAVAEKWIQTPRGVVPLRKFFTGGTTNDSGEEVSWEAIKAALTEIVDGEDKSDPLSDDALAEALKAKGFDIARRTVAKYRGQLNIPTGRMRKTH